MENPFKKSISAEITDQFEAYSVKWKCQKGHTNHQTIIGKNGTQHDICLKCGEHYEYSLTHTTNDQ